MVCSLELSKALFEKGLKIETEKWWIEGTKYGECRIIFKKELDKEFEKYKFTEKTDYDYLINGCRKYPAPSTDELLTVMPKCLINYIKEFPFNVTISLGSIVHQEEDDCLSNALGKMCLWLLEHGYYFNGKELMRREAKCQ